MKYIVKIRYLCIGRVCSCIPPSSSHREGRSMLSPPALGSSRRMIGANGEAPGGRRSSQEALWGGLSSQEAIGSSSRNLGFGGLLALGSSRHLGSGPPASRLPGSPEGFGGRRSSTENLRVPPIPRGGRAPPLGAAAKRGSFFMPEAPRCVCIQSFDACSITFVVVHIRPMPTNAHAVVHLQLLLRHAPQDHVYSC